MAKPCRYTFENELTADVIQVDSFVELSDALQKLGLHSARPTLVLVGGASGIGESDMTRLQQLFVEEIAPILQELGVCVVDGGTDAGIMRFMGQARTKIGATFPLIGVAAVGTVALPNDPTPRSDAAPLEPNHTHFVLVPGSNWGDESPCLSRIASVLSEGARSVTLVVNGGDITFRDVFHSVQAGRPVIAVYGSGRTADKLAAAQRGEATDKRARELVALGQVQAIDPIENPARLAQVIKTMLSNPPLKSKDGGKGGKCWYRSISPWNG